MNRPSLHVLWMYPDVLHLHGDRGNVMALRHVAGLMGIDAEIRRVDSLQEAPDFAWADLLYFGSGELKRMPVVVSALIALLFGLTGWRLPSPVDRCQRQQRGHPGAMDQKDGQCEIQRAEAARYHLQAMRERLWRRSLV